MTQTGPFDYFVVLAEMRTGSNLIEANLNEFDGITCEGEVFNPAFISHQGKEELYGVTLAERDRNPMALLWAIRGQPGLTGFRFFHDHDARVLPTFMQDPRCAKIILTRNPLDSYVSLKIAQATQQWKLGDVKTRRSAQVAFDPVEFEDHVTRLQSFQARILNMLQTSGQTAFYIAYEDANDVAVLNGMAAWLGIDARIEAPSRKLKRQNPEPLEQKLTNPDAVREGLARLDRFNLWRTPNFEPRRGPMLWGLRACATQPLAYLPMPGAPDLGVLDWLGQVDGAGAQGLLGDFTTQGWRDWQRAHPRRAVFTALHHPLARAHEVYLRQVVHGQRANVRAFLARVHGVHLPEKDAMESYDMALHRAGFLAFLRFAAANLNGQTAMTVMPAWASQTRLIEGLAGQAPLHHLLRAERLAQDLPGIGRALGLDLPEFNPVSEPRRFTLGAIYDAEIEAAGRAAYGLDYDALGFEDWQP
ncbi:nodulation protein NodH [Roseibaca sp. Y0-43]|uniref:nodulation protein NodH n=1 Tax=Roseibaca sp. Y0-43 TaxID=2816854 RepID=UPI001D0C7FE2|nr:nodulation protein NodH [Roseibaca sp. Y0-43]MCC1482116.1 nodulation protein NodH [Roseibaca sp. Y0-43]